MGPALGKIISRLFSMKEIRVLILGLDAAGKTTILFRLRFGEFVTTIPTIGFNVETLNVCLANFTAWDVGGTDKIRMLWRHYYPNTNAIIYVVDTNDRERIDEAAEKLHQMLSDDELRDAALLVFANKTDLPNSMIIPETAEKLGLQSLRLRQWNIQGCCGVTGDGIAEGMEWLSKFT